MKKLFNSRSGFAYVKRWHAYSSHIFNHYWLNKLSKDEQEVEIQSSIDYLKKMEVDMDNWTMCYPYGGYNIETVEILKKYNCQASDLQMIGLI